MDHVRRRHQQCDVLQLTITALVIIGLASGCRARPENKTLLILSGLSEDWGYEILDSYGNSTSVSRDQGVTNVGFAAWSPDGNNVAYWCYLGHDGPRKLCNVDIIALQMQVYDLPFPESSFISALVWSTDGKRFLFEQGQGYPKPSELWEMDIDTQQFKMLSRLPVGVGVRSWSPDRSQVALLGNDLFVQNMDGSSLWLIHEKVRGSVDWSPDGKMIAFVSDIEPNPLCWVGIEAVAVPTCLPNEEYVGSLAWSPDGESIAFMHSTVISVVNIRTKRVNTLLDLEDRVARSIDWSPDGRYLAYDGCYSLSADQSCEIYIVSHDGKAHWRLTDNSIADELPVWQP